MATLPHRSPFGNPCVEGCEICEDADAEALAAHLGLADDDAAAADAVRWALFSPDLPRTYHDRDNPGEWREPWGPAESDDAARFELFPWVSEGGCFEDDLSPEEQENELYGISEWVAACKEHAREMEERALEAEYHRLLEVLPQLGGFRDDF